MPARKPRMQYLPNGEMQFRNLKIKISLLNKPTFNPSFFSCLLQVKTLSYTETFTYNKAFRTIALQECFYLLVKQNKECRKQ